MTPDEVRSHPLFQKLTERQQTFVDELLRNGNDKLKAAHKAWVCKTDESANTLARRHLQREDIAFLIENVYGKDPSRLQFTRETALEFAAKKARDSDDPKIALDYFKLVVAMNGWIVKQQDKPPEPTAVDDSNEEFTLD